MNGEARAGPMDLAGEVKRIELKPGDVLVFESEDCLAEQEARRILEQLRPHFPGYPIVITERLKLTVLQPRTADEKEARTIEGRREA